MITALIALAIVIIGPPLFAVTVVAIGCVVGRLRLGPSQLERLLAHAELMDAMGRIYDISSDEEAR